MSFVYVLVTAAGKAARSPEVTLDAFEDVL